MKPEVQEYLTKAQKIFGAAMQDALDALPKTLTREEALMVVGRTMYAGAAAMLLRSLDVLNEIGAKKAVNLLTDFTNDKFPVFGQDVAKLYVSQTLDKKAAAIANDMIEGKITKDEALSKAEATFKPKPADGWFNKFFNRGV